MTSVWIFVGVGVLGILFAAFLCARSDGALRPVHVLSAILAALGGLVALVAAGFRGRGIQRERDIQKGVERARHEQEQGARTVEEEIRREGQVVEDQADAEREAALKEARARESKPLDRQAAEDFLQRRGRKP